MLNLELCVSVLKDILNSYHLSKDPTTIKTFYKCMKEACKNFKLEPEEMHKLIRGIK